VKVLRALGKTDAVGGLAGGDDDLADAELGSRFDDVVSRDGVDAKSLVIGFDQHPRDRRKMHHRIRRRRRLAALETVEAEMGGQGVEGLAAVGQIGDQGLDIGML